MRIEQAVYGGHGAGGYRFLARSPGFGDDWLAVAERLCTGFGERPAGVACPSAVFAQPLGARHVAVVRAADQGVDDAGRPGALAFRLLALPRRLYADLGGDPFRLDDAFPPPWDARGDLPALEWAAGPPPRRTAAAVRAVLDVPHSATLLGGVQALLDGGRVVIERPAPAPGLARDLWALLPTAARADLWPASFAFENRHGFHLVVTPRAGAPDFEGYLSEAHLGDYPEGRYEYALQAAAESGDQGELDGLFARPGRPGMMRLALVLLAGFTVASLFLARAPAPPAAPGAPPPANPPAKEIAPPDALRLPPADAVPALGPADRALLAGRLRGLAGRLKLDLPRGDSPDDLAAALAALDARLDSLAAAPGRDPGRLAGLGPVPRQLRALAWKRGVPDYENPQLTPSELAERLEARLARDGLLPE